MREIDLKTWELKEAFDVYSQHKCPFYSITTKIDVTNIYNFAKTHNLSFYFCWGHVVNTAILGVEEFNIRIVNNKLVVGDANIVSFVCKRKDERKFRFIDVPYNKNILEFCKLAKEIEQHQTTIFGDGKYGNDWSVYLSCTPWFSFSCITNPKTMDTNDFIPRLICDKYVQKGKKKFMNISVEVNHRVVDGYAISQMLQKMEEEIKRLK